MKMSLKEIDAMGRSTFRKWLREKYYPDLPVMAEYSTEDEREFYKAVGKWESKHGIYLYDSPHLDEFHEEFYFDGTEWVRYDDWPEMKVG